MGAGNRCAGRFLLPEVFEESLHGVVVRLRQLLDQIFDGLNSVLAICNLCTTEHQSLKEQPTVALLTFRRGLMGLLVVFPQQPRALLVPSPVQMDSG